MFVLLRKTSLVCCKENLLISSSLYRHMSFKSLHPFYLTVHPDLFNGYPREQKCNDESLKVLHSYLSGLENKQPVYFTSLTFYKKENNDAGQDVISTVRIKLKAKSSAETIRDVMKACDLPYHALDKEISTKLRGWGNSLDMFGEEKDRYAPAMGNLNVGIFYREKPKLTIETWINENRETVTSNQTTSKRKQLGIDEILEDLKLRYGIAGLSGDNLRYSLALVLGGLKQIQKMVDRYYLECDILKGRWIKFGDFNGLDQTGKVVFNINDIPTDWKQGVSLVQGSSHLLDEIKELEMFIKKNCCFGLKFIRPRAHQSVPVQLYLKGFKNVSQNLVKEHCDKGAICKDVLAICDWDGDFVGLSTEGYVKVPLYVTKKVLLSYVERNVTKIKSTRKEYLKNLQVQQDAILSCSQKLGLNSLDTAIDASKTIDACAKLESCDFGESMKEWSIVLSRYYNVSTDGFVHIPWNFTPENSV